MSKIGPIIKCDKYGRWVYYRSCSGFEQWCEYDANGNMIYYRTNDGFEHWYWEGVLTKDPIHILLLQKIIREKAKPS